VRDEVRDSCNKLAIAVYIQTKTLKQRDIKEGIYNDERNF